MSIPKIAIASSNATEAGTTRLSSERTDAATAVPLRFLIAEPPVSSVMKAVWNKRLAYQVYSQKKVIYDATAPSQFTCSQRMAATVRHRLWSGFPSALGMFYHGYSQGRGKLYRAGSGNTEPPDYRFLSRVSMVLLTGRLDPRRRAGPANLTTQELMRIGCSNCRANCVRVLLTGSVKFIATSSEPPLAASLRSDRDCRICLAQAPSTKSQAGEARISEQSARS
jgi:hypothetical protein